jgi:hypothetical protein
MIALHIFIALLTLVAAVSLVVRPQRGLITAVFIGSIAVVISGVALIVQGASVLHACVSGVLTVGICLSLAIIAHYRLLSARE